MKINHRRANGRARDGRGYSPDSSKTAATPRFSKSSTRPKEDRVVIKRCRVQKMSLGEISALERKAAADLSDQVEAPRAIKSERIGSKMVARSVVSGSAPVSDVSTPEVSSNAQGLPWRLDGPVPINVWTPHLESAAASQALLFARMSIVHPRGLALMPDAHPGAQVPVGLVLPTRSALVPRSVGTDIGCFRGDTKVPLLDGSQATLIDLEKRQDPFWVYSISKTGKVVPGKARCVKTRESAPLMRVVQEEMRFFALQIMNSCCTMDLIGKQRIYVSTIVLCRCTAAGKRAMIMKAQIQGVVLEA
jgi:hypothetical protein